MKIEVHLQGGLRKIIDITPGATVGATIGRNVFNADGTLYVPPSSGGSSQLSITSWELILNIPPNVTALANTATTGIYTITGDGTSATRSIQATPGETTVSNGDGVAGNPAVGLADVADTGAGALRGITRDAKGRINGTTDATITGTAGQIDVANGDAVAGPPTISLADVADAGGGTFKLLTRDAKGRLSGTSDGDTDDVPEGAGNLYFTAARVRDTLLTGLSLASSAVISATDSVLSAFGKLQAQITALASSLSGYVPTSRTISTTAPLTGGGNLTANRTLAISAATTSAAGSMSAADKTKLNGIATGATAYTDATARAAVIASSIIDGDTTHAPSGDAVFDALAGKEPTIAGGTTGQFWRGDKTWSNALTGGFSVDVSTLFVDDSNNRVGIGTSSPQRSAHVVGPDGQVASFPPVVGVRNILVLENNNNCNLAFVAGNSGLTGFSFLRSGDTTLRGGMTYNMSDDTAIFSAGAVQSILYSSTYLAPSTDNSKDLGLSSNRWREVFAANGTINTSDAREKTSPRDLSPPELACATDLASLPSMFQWLHAIEDKGKDARIHCSPTVQSVIACMESHGLDPFRYGFVCYDKWEERPEGWNEWPAQEEVLDEEGNVIQPAIEAGRELVQEYRPAGDRYSLRPSELQFFIGRGQEERLRRLEALLNQ